MSTWKISPFKPGSLEDAVGRILMLNGTLTAQEILTEYKRVKNTDLGTLSGILFYLSERGLISRKKIREGHRVIFSYTITRKGREELKKGVIELNKLWGFFPLPE